MLAGEPRTQADAQGNRKSRRDGAGARADAGHDGQHRGREGDAVAAGQPLLTMDAMKMQHEIRSPARGYVRRIAVEAGETIYEGHALLFVEEADVEVKGAVAEARSTSTTSGPISRNTSSAAP